ncbi:hypothetical protein ACFWWT_49100 [Streptomyces sp. NPDC058676]|uniref:hypothetical protein n=1 Tax=unclassified Streptomyces TaxID=2593676 RepID=UPI00364E42E4
MESGAPVLHRWRKQRLTSELLDRIRATREVDGRDAESTAGVIDSQSAKGTATVEAATSGMSSTSTCAAAERDDVVITGLVSPSVVTARVWPSDGPSQ